MNRLNHHHLYLFWVFGRTESFTRTASELKIAQSAVTAQIRQLEEALGLPLVDRTRPRKPEVTAQGRKVLEYADTIFESSRELINWTTSGALPKQRIIRIGALSGLSRNLQFEFMAPLIGATGIRFEVVTGDPRNLLELLLRHELDVILSSRNLGGEGGGRLRVHVLTTSPVVLVGSKSVRLGRGRSLRERISGQSIFVPGKDFEAKAELDAFFERLKADLRMVGEIDDIALLRILALRSGALVAMPELGIRRELEGGEVRVIEKLSTIQQRFYAITKYQLKTNDDVFSLIEKGKSGLKGGLR